VCVGLVSVEVLPLMSRTRRATRRCGWLVMVSYCVLVTFSLSSVPSYVFSEVFQAFSDLLVNLTSAVMCSLVTYE